MIKIKFNITYTNFIGTIGLILSIQNNIDAGIYACAAMILGRSTAKYFGKNKDE